MTRKLNVHTLALWAALPMARTAQVESRLQMILKPNASRHALTRRAALVSLAAAALGVGTLAALRPAAQAQNNVAAKPTAWKQTLPNGATVELLGVSNAPTKQSGGGWWRPDGSPLSGSPFGPPMDNPVAGRDRRAFAMRVTPPSSGSRQEYVGYIARYEVPGATSVSVGYGLVSSYAPRMPGLDMVSAGADSLPTLGKVRCAVASGVWETYTARSVSDLWGWGQPVQRRGGTLLFSRLSEINGSAAITITDTFSNIDRRVVAVDAQSRIYYNDYGGESRTNGMCQSTSIFKGLPLKKVRAIRFQARPYQWAEFTGIALKPGQK